MTTKKRNFTLLEIIIVIFLISLITGAIGYSMKGTLDKGRAFRTEQAIEQLHDLLLICVAEGADIQQVAAKPLRYLKSSALAKNPESLLKDGWGHEFTIKVHPSKTDFIITSDAYEQYHG